MFDLIIRDALALLPHPKDPDQIIEEEVDIAIHKGRISQIGPLSAAKAKEEFLAKAQLHALPGLIDSQVHFREPGLTHKEDIHQGSLSALKGGICAFFDMPNTLPPTGDGQALDHKINLAQKNSFCDFAFYLAALPENKNSLHLLENHKACPGVKLFLGNSTGNLALEDEDSLSMVFSNRKRRTAIHSEDEGRLQERRHLAYKEPISAGNHPLWRDPETGLISTKRVLALAEKHKTPIHILHISTKEEIHFLKQHKGPLVSTELTPQHLSLTAPDCYEEYGTLAQMNPPIRDSSHNEVLWKALQTGLVDMLGSDHAPHTLEEKQKPYPKSPSGMPGTQTLLPLMLNHVNQGRLDLKLLVRLLAHNPAKIFKLKDQGQLKVGAKAHITVVDLKSKWKISSDWLASKCGWSPFEGWSVQGRPVCVFLHGEKVMVEGEVLGPPRGLPIEFLDMV